MLLQTKTPPVEIFTIQSNVFSGGGPGEDKTGGSHPS
jgi:hypothetical protein